MLPPRLRGRRFHSPFPMPDPAAETVDYVAIQRLQAAYADVVNRRAWPELADLFRPDEIGRAHV